jgi:N-acetylneuraminic acid mutarotase
MFGGVDMAKFEEYLIGCGPDGSTCDNSLLPELETDHTWVYDYSANTWTDMRPAVSPPARNSFAMVYDGAADRVILFGGGDWFVDYGDTWAYDYQHNTWTELHPAAGPALRSYGYMAYNSEHDRIVLFGGADFTETILYGDTWVYNYRANTWTLHQPAVSPSPRGWFGMTYSPKANEVVIFGGGTDRYHFTDETWTYRLAPDKWVQVPKP